MPKSETVLANKFLSNLKLSVSEHGERITIRKIHGEVYQATGISDWIGCWKGLFIAIEFKVFPDILRQNQLDFLTDIVECGGIAISVSFRTAMPKIYSWGQEYQILH